MVRVLSFLCVFCALELLLLCWCKVPRACPVRDVLLLLLLLVLVLYAVRSHTHLHAHHFTPLVSHSDVCPPTTVRFTFQRTAFRMMHLALAIAQSRKALLFPEDPRFKDEGSVAANRVFVNYWLQNLSIATPSGLNDEQQLAVAAAVSQVHDKVPLLVYVVAVWVAVCGSEKRYVGYGPYH